ncbi:methyltransferase domain-containing protein [Pseudidiomarina sp.]|uniref:methyltransferase domain-containing protein n=1 Tax=Pseudidiomarina sp. TaxID=2081707 RepID=UPI003A979D33
MLAQSNNAHKSKIAQHFSKAATSYCDHNSLQRQCAETLLQMLPQYTGVTVDAGCGPGVNTLALQQRASHYIGLDFAAGMLQQAQAGYADGCWVQADIEALPFAERCIDTIYANLAVQWVTDLSKTLQQLVDCLKPSGRAVVSTVLDGSLAPLGSCFQRVTGSERHNKFINTRQLDAYLGSLRGVTWRCTQQSIAVPYHQVRDMLHDLKGIGANYTMQQTRGLTKSQLGAVETAMEAHRSSDGVLYLRWEIAFIELIKD